MLESEVRALKTRMEILDCVTRYMRGIDRHDDALLLSAFHDDATTDHALYHGSIQGFVKWVRGRMTKYRICSHSITNHYAKIRGNDARAESYGLVNSLEAETHVNNMWGLRYLDRFECREGIWKIAQREVIMDWYAPRVSTEDGFPFGKASNYKMGVYDETDRATAFFAPFKED